MDMHMAIAKSCNTYFYAMANRIGYDAIAPMAKLLGLGEKFDLPLVSQNFGTIPDSEWKRRRFERSRRLVERPDWTRSDTLNAVIGQGFVIVTRCSLPSPPHAIASGRRVKPLLLGAHEEAAPPARLSGRASGSRSWRHVGGCERERHRRCLQAQHSRHRDGGQDRHGSGPPPCRKFLPADRVASGGSATTACSSSTRPPTSHAMPARS
jgi:hypothetical protein